MRAEHEASYRLLAFGRSQSELALKDKPTKMTKKATTKKHNKKQVTDGISACEQIWHDPHSKMLTTMSLPSVFLCCFFLFFSFSLSLSLAPIFRSCKNMQLVNYTRHHFHLCYNLLQMHIQFYATLTVLIWDVHTHMHLIFLIFFKPFDCERWI